MVGHDPSQVLEKKLRGGKEGARFQIEIRKKDMGENKGEKRGGGEFMEMGKDFTERFKPLR